MDYAPDFAYTCCIIRSVKKKKDPLALRQGERIRTERNKSGWTQKKLAEEIAKVIGGPFAWQGISNCEQGKRWIQLRTALALEVVLGRPAAYFLGLVNEKEAEKIAARMRLEGSIVKELSLDMSRPR